MNSTKRKRTFKTLKEAIDTLLGRLNKKTSTLSVDTSSLSSLSLRNSASLSSSFENLQQNSEHHLTIESSASFDFLNLDHLFASISMPSSLNTDSMRCQESSAPRDKLASLRTRLTESPRLLYKSTASYFKRFSKHTKSRHIKTKIDRILTGTDSNGSTSLYDSHENNFFLNKNFSNVAGSSDAAIENSYLLKALLFDNQADPFMLNFVNYSEASDNYEAGNQDKKESSFSSTVIHNTSAFSAPHDHSQNQTFLIHSDDSESSESDNR